MSTYRKEKNHIPIFGVVQQAGWVKQMTHSKFANQVFISFSQISYGHNVLQLLDVICSRSHFHGRSSVWPFKSFPSRHVASLYRYFLVHFAVALCLFGMFRTFGIIFLRFFLVSLPSVFALPLVAHISCIFWRLSSGDPEFWGPWGPAGTFSNPTKKQLRD